MRGLSFSFSLVLALALAAAVASASADVGTRAGVAISSAPVPSLEPAKTAALWTRLTSTRERRPSATAACRPLRAVFYAASDWLRLATKLAERRSACAEYYISVPPLVADKTRLRPNQANRIRALGPQFHALAEIHFATWSRWVASTGSSWHAAGITARQRMAEAGYDVTQGDSWALNELSSAVRRGNGNARANVREFLRGLYEGDGTRPTRGAALVIGFGQRTGDVSLYQDTLQNWLADSAFWTDMSTYVSDWSQEVYGDVRSYAIPGADVAARREYLNDYLQHKLVLAGVGPTTIEPARAYLREAYSPLANAAWPREGGWGWTMVPVEQMRAYVSAQVNAMRWFSTAAGQARDHWGFAWAPRNTTALSNADFGAQTGAILDRLAAAVRDSGDPFVTEDPGIGACGPTGQNLFCVGDHAEGRPNEAWRSFRGWTQAVLALAPTTAVAGTPTAPVTLSLATGTGLPVPNRAPLTVTLSSSSPQGRFSTSAAGPWTPTLALSLPVGTNSAVFHYLDTLAGSHTLTASAAGATSGTQTVTVAPAAPRVVRVAPVVANVPVRDTRRFAAAATDAYGNAVPASYTWRVTPAALGKVVPEAGGTTATFTAARLARSGVVDVVALTAAGPIEGSAHVKVVPAPLRIGPIGFTRIRSGVQVTVNARDVAGRPVARALVSVRFERNDDRRFTARKATGSSGRARYAIRVTGGECLRVRVTRVRAVGFTWDRRTPRNRFCAR